MYFDGDVISFAAGLLGGGCTVALVWAYKVLAVARLHEDGGVDPIYNTGRGDRSSHVHSYDTMDAGTKGKWVCGICRKPKKE